MRNNRVLNRVDFPMKEKISRWLSMVIRKAFTFWWKQMHITPNFVDLKKVLIFAFSILHEQTIAKARSKLVG